MKRKKNPERKEKNTDKLTNKYLLTFIQRNERKCETFNLKGLTPTEDQRQNRFVSLWLSL